MPAWGWQLEQVVTEAIAISSMLVVVSSIVVFTKVALEQVIIDPWH